MKLHTDMTTEQIGTSETMLPACITYKLKFLKPNKRMNCNWTHYSHSQLKAWTKRN